MIIMFLKVSVYTLPKQSCITFLQYDLKPTCENTLSKKCLKWNH